LLTDTLSSPDEEAPPGAGAEVLDEVKGLRDLKLYG
jgi:hypothetical protein